MKRKSAMITVGVCALLAIMIILLGIQNKGFALKVLCYVIPFFAVSFGVYGILLCLAEKYTWTQEKRKQILYGNKPVKVIINIIPKFAAIYAAMQVSNVTDVQCVIAGVVLGLVGGFSWYFTTEKLV